MTTDHLNQYIGICGICDGDVKEQYIIGWGIVPYSAQCIKCLAKAKFNDYGNIVITMENKK